MECSLETARHDKIHSLSSTTESHFRSIFSLVKILLVIVIQEKEKREKYVKP